MMNKFLNDSRTDCKYGEKCYQKNPEHHRRFKHPSTPSTQKNLDTSEESEQNQSSPPSKKQKLCEAVDPPDSPNKVLSTPETNEVENDSSDEEEEVLSESPEKREEEIRQKFLVDMPQDFYDFWDFCEILNQDHPEDALKCIGLQLVGPFDVLSGKLREVQSKHLRDYLCHWRFYYDPPEFQTVIVGKVDEYHIGYYRDDPAEPPNFLASMSSTKTGIIHIMKEDLFATVYSYLNSTSGSNEDEKKRVLRKLKSFASEKGYSLDQTPSERLKERKKKVVSKSFHGAGIVVPFDKKNDVGYREIPETTTSLKRIMKSIAEAPTKAKKEQNFEALHELLTNAQFANDEGDFGMGLELGLDLFTYGSEDFHSCILHLLTVAYDLLDRKPFGKIIKAHLKNRRKGSNMSSFQL